MRIADLWKWLAGGIWKSLEVWSRKPFTSEESIMGYSGRRLEDKKIGIVGTWLLSFLGENKDSLRNWARGHLCEFGSILSIYPELG